MRSGEGDRPAREQRVAGQLAWNAGGSVLHQLLGVALVWGFVVALHLHNNGLWYQGDSPRHAGNGVFWWDFLHHLPTSPFTFALEYFARYPVIAPTLYPPVFYLLEGAAFSVFGISPFVAKDLVLVFALVAAFYMVLWLRRAIGPEAGWGGALLLLQPGVIVWSNAIMLNVPAMTLGLSRPLPRAPASRRPALGPSLFGGGLRGSRDPDISALRYNRVCVARLDHHGAMRSHLSSTTAMGGFGAGRIGDRTVGIDYP